jgi:Zn-dependent peptidase ImmA (M78 family)
MKTPTAIRGGGYVTTASIYYEVLRALKICPTRKPYDLLDTIGAVTVFSHAYSPDGLKGYSTIFNRTMYAVVNANLSEEDMMFAAGHEAAHLIVHKSEIMASTVKMMKDFNVFDHSGRYEKEANTFLADFLVSDEDVFEILSDEDKS